ncbi:MAG: formylglycine-generating enzyme family protein [Planctomycetota bacterium]
MSRNALALGRAVCATVVCVSLVSAASAVTIETVPVGNVGNATDSNGYGEVVYDYRIATYEVTAGQYAEFLNAVAAADPYGLYNTSMATSSRRCGIDRSGASGSYTYSIASDWADRPVNYVGWGDAVRFANWLHNGQPTGAQDLTTTEDGAYYLNGATSDADLLAVTREADWLWAIPSEDEWYKAAYHKKDDGLAGTYFDYATGSDTDPSNALVDPDPGNNATYNDGMYTIGSPYYRTEVGAHENSASPYGTFDQSGNVWEWNESGRRGGGYTDAARFMRPTSRYDNVPNYEKSSTGFRVATIPEPGSMALLALGGLALLRKRRG